DKDLWRTDRFEPGPAGNPHGAEFWPGGPQRGRKDDPVTPAVGPDPAQLRPYRQPRGTGGPKRGLETLYLGLYRRVLSDRLSDPGGILLFHRGTARSEQGRCGRPIVRAYGLLSRGDPGAEKIPEGPLQGEPEKGGHRGQFHRQSRGGDPR